MGLLKHLIPVFAVVHSSSFCLTGTGKLFDLYPYVCLIANELLSAKKKKTTSISVKRNLLLILFSLQKIRMQKFSHVKTTLHEKKYLLFF